MTEENTTETGENMSEVPPYDPNLLNNAFEQGYKQGWLHSQQALSEWITELGGQDKENENYYRELGQLIANLQIVEEENGNGTSDMSNMSQDNDSDLR